MLWGSHSVVYEESYLLVYNAVQHVESQWTFRGNQYEAGSKQGSLVLNKFPLGINLDPEGGGNMLLRNVSWLSNDYNDILI
jgi:hypothetical protein